MPVYSNDSSGTIAVLIRHRDRAEIVIDAPAKVNLFLQVLNRRPDGFHSINSLFQAVSLYDRLRFRSLPTPEVIIHLLTDVPLPVNEDNLIARAYNSLRRRFDLKLGLEVWLEKNVPIAAGLGGGSSDGAATLMTCNLLCDIGLSDDDLRSLGAEIGSDVPFFFSNGQALVSGRGEILTETSFPTDYSMVLATPNVSVSTQSAYAGLQRSLTTSADEYKLSRCRTVEQFVHELSFTDNDFEQSAFQTYPELEVLRRALLRIGAQLVRMTGSGPTMFGIFERAPRVEEDRQLTRGDWQVHVVRPISLA
ncbi:MAG TPA: 4-(cytidine 5'-diphospho)-2-C-methyl-D-erythritol kinase [Candidatus Deferrimicrobium sp.]|nr:4-(cytidine 5'-diphospho)-2-C-methyl-D-erythritol kinase [Candidatus Deferrimicrobium sp.]